MAKRKRTKPVAKRKRTKLTAVDGDTLTVVDGVIKGPLPPKMIYIPKGESIYFDNTDNYDYPVFFWGVPAGDLNPNPFSPPLTSIKKGMNGPYKLPGVQTVVYIALRPGPYPLPGGGGIIMGSGSSRRFKYDIENMGDASRDLLKLRPVTFRYKQAQDDGSHPLQYGLIAEEVAEVYPGLVRFDETGEPLTVHYHVLPAMLLNEVQKQHREIDVLQDLIRSQQDQLRAQEEQLREQEERIQKLEPSLLSK